jgi:hypothetical protein
MVYVDQKRVLEGGNLRCNELVKALEKLGFKVRDCGKGGHKVVSHPGIPDFHGSNFNGGHRPTAQVKPLYIKKLLNIVERYESDIRKRLGEKHED